MKPPEGAEFFSLASESQAADTHQAPETRTAHAAFTAGGAAGRHTKQDQVQVGALCVQSLACLAQEQPRSRSDCNASHEGMHS